MVKLLNEMSDTIVALATPPGRAGISVIRLSGKQSLFVLHQMTPYLKKIEPQQLVLTKVYNHDQDLLDHVLVVFFKAPHSLTGEDIVEFQCHGSPIIVDNIIQETVFLGARLARPGEFLQRGFINDKYDLTEVEAIAALIDAKTRQAARASLQTASGRLGKFVLDCHNELSQIRVLLESSLDFSEEDISEHLVDKAREQLSALCDEVKKIIVASSNVIKLHTGVQICFLGPPNAGKSSLLNYFAKDDIAIVHEQAGTTRDTLKTQINIAGMPVTLTDTAGLRETQCAVEQVGIEKGRQQASFSSVVIYMVPYGQHFELADLDFLKDLNVLKILLVNKIDLQGLKPYEQNHKSFDIEIGVSILKKQGLEKLHSFLESRLMHEVSEETLFVSNMRQFNVIKDFLVLIEESRDIIQQVELAANLLAKANDDIGALTGERTTEDLLGRIFSTFCIGK